MPGSEDPLSLESSGAEAMTATWTSQPANFFGLAKKLDKIVFFFSGISSNSGEVRFLFSLSKSFIVLAVLCLDPI